MNKQNKRLFLTVAILAFVAVASMLAVGFLAPQFILATVLAWVSAIAALLITEVVARQQTVRRMRVVAKRLDTSSREALEAHPLPILLVSDDGKVLYHNEVFSKTVLKQEAVVLGQQAETVFSGFSMEDVAIHGTLDIQYGDKKLTAYIAPMTEKSASGYLLYLFDNTSLKNIAAEYTASRPVVLQFCIDNLEEATQHLRDGDRARISGQIETMLDDWIVSYSGVLQKHGSNRFLAIAENRNLNDMTKNRFAILDKVRSAFPEVEGGITLSVGVGQGKTLGECRQMARQALDMALSRGGDQAAIKTVNGYDFYGGKSRGVERRTKVRTRMVANALRDLIIGSEQVMIMGHRLSDLDCLGSGVALAVACRSLGVQTHVVVRRRSSMARQLIERYEETGRGDLFLDPEEAIELIGKRMLLIVTDTHAVSMLDAPDFYDLAQRVVVIDHHRRMVNYIQDAVLTYHEPSSSSACELVTELIPYMLTEKPGRLEAEALLSGIMLDTRNFVLRTGVRTFEAAAYLRSLGADTVSVKKMFAESLEMYRLKNDLVACAELYRETAIAMTGEDMSSRRAAAAQAADDLLSVQGVHASFVISPIGQELNISARSFGEINVQLIMEQLGGGGHQTMAATQLRGVTPVKAKMMLQDAIDAYLEQQEQNN